jgi:hypothetical protein
MKGKLELGDYPEIAATTAQSPEKLRFVMLACAQFFSIRSDHFRRNEIVYRHTVFTGEPAETTTEG